MLAVSATHDSLSAFVGDSATSVLEVRNDGEADFTFTEFVFTETPAIEAGPQFRVTPYLHDQVVEPGAALQFEVAFEPREVGEAQCDIVISTSVGRDTVHVTGQGLNNAPVVNLAEDIPETVCSGQSLPFAATVSDVEDAPDLTVIEVTLTSDVEGALAAGHLLADGTFEADVALEDEGSQTLTLVATDSHGDSGSASVTVDVLPGSGDDAGTGQCGARSREMGDRDPCGELLENSPNLPNFSAACTETD